MRLNQPTLVLECSLAIRCDTNWSRSSDTLAFVGGSTSDELHEVSSLVQKHTRRANSVVEVMLAGQLHGSVVMWEVDADIH